MAHTHDVYDMENHFEINGSSRFIKETSETKLVVVQGDHKSEVLTFKMPRYIDGHDMTLCNKIRIHYINLDTKTNNKSADVYEVTDLTLCEECEDVLTFTWTIEAPATKYSGTLSFLVKFECTEGENVLYQWNTAKYVSVNVLAGIDNSEEFVDKYSNVLEEWYNELTKGADSIEELNQQALAEIELAKEDAKEDIQSKANSTMAAMDQFSSNTYNSFKDNVDIKAARTLASIPEDYSTLDEDLKNVQSVLEIERTSWNGSAITEGKASVLVQVASGIKLKKDEKYMFVGKLAEVSTANAYFYLKDSSGTSISFKSAAHGTTQQFHIAAGNVIDEDEFTVSSDYENLTLYFMHGSNTSPATVTATLSLMYVEKNRIDKIEEKSNAIDDIAKTIQKGNINNTTLVAGGMDVKTGEDNNLEYYSKTDGYIAVEPSKTIYVMHDNEQYKDAPAEIFCFDEKYNFLEQSKYIHPKKSINSMSNDTVTFTLPNECSFIRVQLTTYQETGFNLGVYYTDYVASSIEPYTQPKNAVVLCETDGFDSFSERIITDFEQTDVLTSAMIERDNAIGRCAALEKMVSDVYELIKKHNPPTVLDSGQCGENLYWYLYSDGLLKITGHGRSYDFVKGIMIGMTDAELAAYKEENPDFAYYCKQEGKTYQNLDESSDDFIGYVAPWYRYRNETDWITDSNPEGYDSHDHYDKWNPNGWVYNRIEIDEGVTYIGDWMFYRVCGARELFIPEGVTELGDWAVRFSTTLKFVSLPNTLEYLGDYAVSRNIELESIRYGNSIKNVGVSGFNNVKLRTLVLPKTTTAIGDNLCSGASNNPSSLIYADLGNITKVPSQCFVYQTKLKTVVMSDEITSIGYGAFYGCLALEKIRIPSKVVEIETDAFIRCDNLKEVYIDSPTVCESIQFIDSAQSLVCNAEKIFIKDGISTIGSWIEKNFQKGTSFNGYTMYTRVEYVQ